MFDNSDIKEPKRGAGFWLKIAAAVILLLLAFNFYFVNRTDSPATSPTPLPVQYTEGAIVDGQISIEPGATMPYRFDLNHRSTINGNFRVVGKDPWIACLILDATNYQKWRAGTDFTAITSTGLVPVGRVFRMVDPGTYFLVFDNRSSQEKNAVADVSFSVK